MQLCDRYNEAYNTHLLAQRERIQAQTLGSISERKYQENIELACAPSCESGMSQAADLSLQPTKQAYAQAKGLGCRSTCQTKGFCQTGILPDCPRDKDGKCDPSLCYPINPPPRAAPDLEGDCAACNNIFDIQEPVQRFPIRSNIPIPTCDYGDSDPWDRKPVLVDKIPVCDGRDKVSLGLQTKETAQVSHVSAPSPAEGPSVCQFQSPDFRLWNLVPCTFSSVGDIAKDLVDLKDVRGKDVLQKLGVVFGSQDRPFYLALFLAFFLVVVVFLVLLVKLFSGPSARRTRR